MSEPTRLLITLFESLASIERLEEREELLEYTCRDDPAMLARLKRMLSLQEEANDFFDIETAPVHSDDESPESDSDSENNLTEGVGARIGRYRLLERLGEGGCGVVYLAEQLEPVKRKAALKIIRLGMDTESVIARFEMERQSLAMMDHPNIARVYDVGGTRTGRPYFVMQFVDGQKVTDYCNAKQLGVPQRLKLFIKICQAIQHAHQKGVIHRDIKPSNILVCENDGKAVPKVIDFGIAKATAGGTDENATFTAIGQFVGTPAYMSPEQAAGHGLDVDTRSDIFSLGSLLYELLTGRPPFDPKQLRESGADEIRRILQEVEPREPSAVISSLGPDELKEIATQRGCDSQKLAGLLRGDLDRIVKKALEKDRKRRYGTADSLAADVNRYLQNEPVLARPSGRIYLFQKFVRRNRIAVGSTAGIAAALVLGLGLAYGSYLREREARHEQARLRQMAEIARVNEAKLRENATIRESIAQVAVLMSEGKTAEADAQLRLTPLSTIEPSLEAANVLRSLGGWNAMRGRWKEASESFLLLTQANSLTSPERIALNNDLIAPSPALAENGNMSDFVKFRDWVISRFGETTDVNIATQVIQATLLLPADREFLDRLAPLGQLVGRAKSEKGLIGAWRAWSMALYEYRCGNFQQSLTWGTRALEYKAPNPYISALIHPILAMAHCRAGHGDAAWSDLEKSRELIEIAFMPELAAAYEPMGRGQGYWWDWVLAKILFREAELTIQTQP
jgi:eukaryotic-like serine/threonine-protein kinase